MRIAGSDADVARDDARRRYVPVVTVLVASLLDLLPIVVSTPLMPDLAFLVLIAWRLLRPEIWTAPMALPLGLFNDLVSGHPLGQSMALWTLAFLAFELLDSRVGWRDFWMDWMFASVAIPFYILAGWYVVHLMGSQTSMVVLVPQILLSLLAFPIVARIVLELDHWRLGR